MSEISYGHPEITEETRDQKEDITSESGSAVKASPTDVERPASYLSERAIRAIQGGPERPESPENASTPGDSPESAA